MHVFKRNYFNFFFIIAWSLSFSFSEVQARAADVDVDLEAAIPPATSSAARKWSDWLWSSPSSKSVDVSTEATIDISTELDTYVKAEETESSYLSPFSMMSYLGVDMGSMQLASDVFNMYYYPDSTSYMSMATTFLKLLLFFMPGAGIVQQAYFLMDMAKITYKVGNMYFNGYGTLDIATAVAPDLLKAVLLSRRDESYVSQYTLHAGDSVDLSSMDATSFLNYVDSMKFPRLSVDEENEIREDVANVLTKYNPNILSDDLDSLVDSFEQTIKFFALFNPVHSIQNSFDSEEENVERVFQFLRVLSSSNPKNLISQKFKNIRNIFD